MLGGRHRSRRHRPALATAAVAAGNAGTLIIGLSTGILSARALGPALRGQLLATQTWAGIAGVALTLGVTQAVVVDRGKDADLAGPLLLQTALAGCTGGLLFAAFVCYGIQPWLGWVGVVGAAALTAGVVTVSNSAGIAQRRGKMLVEFQLVRLLPPAAGLGGVALLWMLHVRRIDIWILVLGLGALVPSAAVLAARLVRMACSQRGARLLPDRALLRRAAAAYTTVVGSQIIYRLDALLVASLMVPYAVAYYGIASSASFACATIGQAVGMLTFSGLRTVDSWAARRHLIAQGVIRTLFVTSAIAIPVTVIAPTVIKLLYGYSYVAASAPTRVLVLAAIPLSADYLLVHALLSLAAAQSVYKVQIPVALVTVALLLAFIPTGNLAAIALISLLTYAISAVALLFAALRFTRLSKSCYGVRG